MTADRNYSLLDAHRSAPLGWLLGALIAASLAGCSSRDHGKPDVPRAAVAIALAWTEAGMPAVDVTPAPAPDGDATQCWNCKGRGKVGDGNTMMTCQVCGGSGRSTPMSYQQAPPAPLPEVDAVAEIINDSPPPPELAPRTWYTDHAAALNLAAEIEGGFVVAICSPDWFDCGPCRALITALTPKLADQPEGVVWLKTTLSKAEAKKLGATAFPFAIVMQPGGNALDDGRVKPTVLAKGAVNGIDGFNQLYERACARLLQPTKEQPK